VETRKDAVTCTPWKIISKSEDVNQLVTEYVNQCIPDIIENSLDAIFYGHTVTQVIWDKDIFDATGLMVPKNILFEDEGNFFIDKFGNLFHAEFGRKEKPTVYGKYILTRSRANNKNPNGTALLAKLYYPFMFHKVGFEFWAKFLEKFGTPILYGKIPYEINSTTGKSTIEELTQVLGQANRPSAIVTKPEGDIKLLSPSGQGVGFKEFVKCIEERIQKCILGQTLTSSLSGQGSLAAAKVHNLVRMDKRHSDIKLVTTSINKLLKYFKEFNNIQDDVIFEFEKDVEIDEVRAKRDEILTKQGVAFTPEYYSKNYNLKLEEDFSIREQTLFEDQFSHEHHDKCDLRFTDRKKLSKVDKARIDLENDFIEEDANQEKNDPTADELLSIIKASKSEKDLNQRLSVFGFEQNKKFTELLTLALLEARVKGIEDAEDS